MQVIVFQLNDRFYGFETASIEEITRPLSVAHVPHSPEWAHGLINLRGQIMTLIDLPVCLGIPEPDENWYVNTIIVNAESNPIALMVGDVLGVVTISESDIQSAPDDDSNVLGYLSAYGKMVTLIELDTILIEKEDVA